KGDKLGQALYTASGSRAEIKQFQIDKLRQTGLTDDLIISRFKEYLADKQPTGKKWKYAIWNFHKSLTAPVNAESAGQLAKQPLDAVSP
ncbi:MAG: hypothetical protein LAP21_25330, partial [Acidobacteriia bacterium]|nr:hypothetical protein [Terriglobia bacterium]